VPYSVVIDKQICQSSGNCVNDQPDAFGFDEDDLGEVLDAAATLAPERLLAIADRCPAIAIGIFDESGAKIEAGRK
jgi:ferredoxin